MVNSLIIIFGKSVSKISKTLNRGNGSTWPGHIALKGNKNFIRDILSDTKTKIIIIAGTNGKTTTSGLIRTGLEKNGKTVIQNTSGANLLNGVASTLLLNSNAQGKLTQNYAIFEVDENALPHVLKQVTPDYLVLLNLFRDQLDRYGEINSIAQKWQEAIKILSNKTKLILNADDPQIAYLGLSSAGIKESKQSPSTRYFSLQENKTKHPPEHSADSVFCPKCDYKLTFENTTFSHLGKWKCTNCGLTHPSSTLTSYPIYPLTGTYNKYNTIAAALVLQELGFDEKQINNAFKNFTPAFGRQEIVAYHGKNVQLFLSKNPTSFNQSYATLLELHATTLLIILNDRVPDGHDISWIWDVDLPDTKKFNHILLAGDRVYDIALRLKYELDDLEYKKQVETFEHLEKAIAKGIQVLSRDEMLYILPNYSAMLEARKVLTG